MIRNGIRNLCSAFFYKKHRKPKAKNQRPVLPPPRHKYIPPSEIRVITARKYGFPLPVKAYLRRGAIPGKSKARIKIDKTQKANSTLNDSQKESKH